MDRRQSELKLGYVGAEMSSTLWARGGKRIFDVAFTLILLVALSPLLVLLAVLTPLTSRGGVLFVQTRAGRNGQSFRLFKFRTMRGDRTPDVKELVPLDHPDITGLGKVLRRLKLDELPQLFNVLRGEMSLVGPRPTLLDQVERYDSFQRERLRVRPGLTGLAQVNTHALISWEQRILYDVAYVAISSFWTDLGILLKTPLVILLGERRFTRRFEDTRYARILKNPKNNAQ